MKLRLVEKNDARFNVLKAQYMKVYTDFKQYLLLDKLEKEGDIKFKNPSKGKPTEYPRFLIYSLILHEEIFEGTEINLDVHIILKKLYELQNLDDFSKFNLLKNHRNFYGSTITAFANYVEFKDKEKIDLSDNECTYEAKQLVEGPKKKPKPISTRYGLQYTRSITESVQAKIKSEWKCEIDPSHDTFINDFNNKPYVEAHHLLPMAAQKDYEYTIDFADNIVSLCPNCHRKIHHASKDEVKKMLEQLFKKRGPLYPKYNIDLSLEKLLSYYHI